MNRSAAWGAIPAIILSLGAQAKPRPAAPAEARGLREDFPSRLLGRSVPIALHVPSEAAADRWRAAHPGPLHLVLFLPGAWDSPSDLLKRGIHEGLSEREASGAAAPALWVAVDPLGGCYADRRDGSFPYRRFLVEELLPALERRFPGYGGTPEARSVAGFSLGGFGALNLLAHSEAFGRAAVLSPALVRAPFGQVNWLVRRRFKRDFGPEGEDFGPWNPWSHLGALPGRPPAQLVLGCGTEDPYGLAEVTRTYAERCRAAGRPAALRMAPGGHDWAYWTPAFLDLAPWLDGGQIGGAAPPATKMQQQP